MTFGDKRPHTPVMPMPRVATRVLLPHAKPMPDVTTYRQTQGTHFMWRFTYRGVALSGVSATELDAMFDAREFYMTETEQGRNDSVAIG